MPFADLRTFHDPDLHLPIGDTVYTITSPNANEGIRLRRLFAGALEIDDAGELDEMMKLLGATKNDDGTYTGGVYQEMVDNGVSWDEMQHVGQTALLRYGQSVSLAETYWVTAGSITEPQPEPEPTPKAPAKKAAPRKSTSRKKA